MFPPLRLSLKHRLTVIGIAVALLPFPFAVLVSHRDPPAVAPKGRPGLTSADLDHLVDTAYQTVEFSQRELARTAVLAVNLITNDHGVRQLKAHPIVWPVSGGHPVKLPALLIRKTLVVPAGNLPHAFVTNFAASSGAECSIFQRMNSSGDMLWIGTSIHARAGDRIIGTVLPASSPAVAAVLAKSSQVGPLAAPGLKSLAAFEPISRSDGAIIGMLAISRPEKDELQQIRQSLYRLPVRSGAQLFAGSNDLPLPPASLAELVANARNRPGHEVEARYKLIEKGEMVAHLRYFAPWDWLVGAAVPAGAMATPPVPVPVQPDLTLPALTVVFLGAALFSAVVFWRSASSFTSPLSAVGASLKQNIDRLLAFADSASERMPASQPPAIGRASAAISQTGRNTRLILSAVSETALASQHCKAHLEKASAEVGSMEAALAELASANSQVSGLVKEIGSIALQSRLLALNASIEAARAGHHGSSFSVVAEEFGKLAQRCSENAKSTTALLTSSVTLSTSSTEHVARLREEIESLSCQTGLTTESLTKLHEMTSAQARTVTDLERFVQRRAKPVTVNSEIGETIRAEAMAFGENAEAILALAGDREKPSKRRAPETPSFPAKARANTRSARRAC